MQTIIDYHKYFHYLLLFVFMIHAQNLTLTAGYNNLPEALFGSFITVNSQDKVVIIGGCNNYERQSMLGCTSDDYSRKIYIWDTKSSNIFKEISSNYSTDLPQWNPSNGYPFPIYKDTMYVAWYNVLYQYNTINQIWIKNTIRKLPIALYHPCTVYDKMKNKIYLLGGYTCTSTWTCDSAEDWDSNLFDAVQVYDIDSDSWESYRNMPFPVYGGSCVLTNATIYYFGGVTKPFARTTGSISKYEIEKNQWTILSAEFKSNFGSRAILVNDTNIFIFGGAQDDEYSLAGLRGQYYGVSVSFDDVYLFETINESIQVVTTMNYSRYAALIALVNGHIYIAGGAIANFSFKPGRLLGIQRILSDTEISVELWKEENDESSTTSTASNSTSTAVTNWVFTFPMILMLWSVLCF
eukprot:490390_1